MHAQGATKSKERHSLPRGNSECATNVSLSELTNLQIMQGSVEGNATEMEVLKSSLESEQSKHETFLVALQRMHQERGEEAHKCKASARTNMIQDSMSLYLMLHINIYVMVTILLKAKRLRLIEISVAIQTHE